MTDRNGRNEQRRQDEDFVKRVLGATSGSPCERAADLLPDLTDGVLEGMDLQLVQAHLEHCPGCRTLAVTLGWLEPLLPAMAEIDPGPEFTQQVLDRTSLAAPGVAAGPITEPGGFGPAGLMDRLGRWWQGQILRPVFPLQVAYAATVILVLLTATPVSPFRSAPGRLLEVVQAGPTSMPVVGPWLDAVGGESSAWIGEHTGRVRRTVGDEAAGAWRRASTGLSDRMDRTAPERGTMKTHLVQLGGNLRQGKLGDAGYELHRFLQAGQGAWSLWWHDESTIEEEQSVIERRTP